MTGEAGDLTLRDADAENVVDGRMLRNGLSPKSLLKHATLVAAPTPAAPFTSSDVGETEGEARVHPSDEAGVTSPARRRATPAVRIGEVEDGDFSRLRQAEPLARRRAWVV